MQRLAYALLALIVLSYFFSWWSIRKVKGEVHLLTSNPQVGHYMEEKVTAGNTDWLPKLLLEIHHKTVLPGHHNRRLINLLPRQSFSWTYRSLCQRRGLYNIGDLELTGGDPLGLFSRKLQAGGTQQVLVYPATIELSDFMLPWGKEQGEGYERRRFQFTNQAVSGIREYAFGDSFSRIHWPSTARLSRFMSKVFDKEPSGPTGDVWIAVDLNESSQAGEGTESTAEYGITIAASLVKKFLDVNHNVGLISWGGKPQVLSPQRGSSHLNQLMEILALADVKGESPLVEVIESMEGSLTPQPILILITPARKEEIIALVSRAAVQKVNTVIILLDGSSFGKGTGQRDSLEWLTGKMVDTYVVSKGDEIEEALDSKLRNWAYRHRHHSSRSL